jgi:O-antigen/teichoic acid export membrane protein
MGIIKRQSLKSSIVNYAGVLLGVIFFNFIFPHLLSAEHLGMIRLLQSLMFILVALPTLGLGHMLLRFYSIWNAERRVEAFNGFAMLAIGIACVIFMLLFLLFRQEIIGFYREHSALFIPYYYLVIPMVVAQAYIQYIEIFSMVKLRVAFPSFIREILIRIMLIVVVYFFADQIIGEDSFFYSIPLIYCFSAILILFYAVKIQHFRIKNPLHYFQNNKDLKHQLLYGGGMFLVIIFSNTHNFIDGVLLSSYLGVGAFGIYGIPLVLGQMIQVPYRAISLISIPIIREAWIENDLDKIKRLNKSIGINLYLIGTFLFTLLIINSSGIFKLLPPQYEIAHSVLFIIGLGRLFDMAFGLNSEILNSSQYYKYYIYLNVLLVALTIALNMLLIPIYGMNGAALAVSISLTIFNMCKTWIIYSKFGFHCFSRHYITLTILMLAVIGVLYFVPFIQFIPKHMFVNALVNIAFKSMLGAGLFLVPLFFLQVSPDFNDFVKLILNGKIFKGGHKMDEL